MHRRSPTAPLLPLLLAALLLVVPASPATAQAVVYADPSGDVVNADTGAKVAANSSVDITRAVAEHRTGDLRVTTSVRELATSGWYVVTAVKTPKARFKLLVLKLNEGDPTVILSRNDESVACDGLQTGSSLVDDTVTASIPRRCLDRPSWVKVGVLMSGQQDGVGVSDDAHRDAKIRKDGEPALGRRLRRG